MALVTRPEFELVACCARTHLEPTVAGRVRSLLEAGVDWDVVVQLARQHGISSLLFHHLNSHFAAYLPAAVHNLLRDEFRDNARLNLYLTGELLRLLDRLEASGIPAVPYKGPVLAATAYGNLSLRLFGDLDLLVREQDVAKLKQLLLTWGFQQTWPHTLLTADQEALHLRYHCVYQFTRDEGNVVVEAHWNLTPSYFSFAFDFDQHWSRLKSVNVAGKSIRSFAPEDLLLILSVHGAKHGWERLIWVCDIAQIVRTGRDLDWSRALRLAGRLGAKRMLLLSLFLAHELLAVDLPRDIMAAIDEDGAIVHLAAEACMCMNRAPNTSGTALEDSLFDPFHMKVRERWSDRLRYFVRALTFPTSKDWSLIALPRILSPAYHVLRPIRLGWKYGVSPITSASARAAD